MVVLPNKVFVGQTPVTISSQPLFMEGTQPHSATVCNINHTRLANLFICLRFVVLALCLPSFSFHHLLAWRNLIPRSKFFHYWG